MNEYNLVEDLLNRCYVDVLDSKTLNYRLNGFIYACGMDLSDGTNKQLVGGYELPLFERTLTDSNNRVLLTWTRDTEKGDGVILDGEYNDLKCLFINYYEKDKNKNKVNQLPFIVSMKKKVDDTYYMLRMETDLAPRVQFYLATLNGDVLNETVFYASVLEFSKILRIVQAFNNDPEMVFSKYAHTFDNKKVFFASRELNSVMQNDKKLDEPYSKFVKKIKMITNND